MITTCSEIWALSFWGIDVMSSISLVVSSFTACPVPPAGLPCSCPDRFVPVCASNGRTYPSACVARCLGFKDHQFVFGLCRVSNPCAGEPCQRSQRYERPRPRPQAKLCTALLPPSCLCFFFLSLTDSQVVLLGGCDYGQQTKRPLSVQGLLFHVIHRSSVTSTSTHKLWPHSHCLNGLLKTQQKYWNTNSIIKGQFTTISRINMSL